MAHQIKKAQFSLLQPSPIEGGKANINILDEIELNLDAELGSTLLCLRDIINLREGQVVALNKIAGDNVDLRANEQWLARGEVLVLNEVLGIRISSFNLDEENSDRNPDGS
jgi:flagellar motor switch protein FliN/FliY